MISIGRFAQSLKICPDRVYKLTQVSYNAVTFYIIVTADQIHISIYLFQTQERIIEQ